MRLRLDEQPEGKWADDKKSADCMGMKKIGNELCLVVRRMENHTGHEMLRTDGGHVRIK